MAATQDPILNKYRSLQKRFPEAIILMRVGDFYETFGNGAIECSKILGISLLRRIIGINCYIELAGFPRHALDTYVTKLIRAGNRVAICDEDIGTKEESTIKAAEIISPGKQSEAEQQRREKPKTAKPTPFVQLTFDF